MVSRSANLLKSSSASSVEVFINGRSLASQKLTFAWSGNSPTESAQQPALHAYIGTLPFFRRPAQLLKWRIASVYLVEEALTVETLRKIVALGAAYVGNFQVMLGGSCL